MPELPEVEAWRTALDCVARGRLVKAVDFAADDAKVLVGASRAEIVKRLPGSKCMGAFRKGKHLWLAFASAAAVAQHLRTDKREPRDEFSVGLHMGMTGAIQIEGKRTLSLESYETDESGEWPPAYAKLALSFDSASLDDEEKGKGKKKEKKTKEPSRVAFTNRRRFGRVRFITSGDPTLVEPYAALGPDALNDLPGLGKDWFKEKLAPSGRAIKSALLDQGLVR